MAIIQGGTTNALVDVDTGFKAQRVSLRPPEVINWNSIAGSSGALTGVAAAGAVFSFRNTGANLLMVRRVQLDFGVTTAFTTAQALAYSMFLASGFSASDTGGTALYTAGQNKHRSGMTNITSAPDIRVASTAALGAGTRTLNTAAMGAVVGAATAVGAAMSPALLFSHDASDYPLLIAQNEGFVITNDIAMGSTGVIRLQATVEFAEVLAYPY